MLTHRHDHAPNISPIGIAITNVHPQRCFAFIGCDSGDSRKEFLDVGGLKEAQEGGTLEVLRAAPEYSFDVVTDEFNRPVMVGHDARDCDAGVKERPRNSRGATLDDGKTESASICGRESHPHIRLELRAVSLAKVTERPVALYRSRCEQCPRCFHFGLVDRAQNLKGGDTVQRIGGPAEKLASSLVRLKNDQVIEVEGYEWVPALVAGP